MRGKMGIGILVGLEVKVVASQNPLHSNIFGTIEDDAHNVLAIRTANGTKTVPKKGTRLLVKVGGKWVPIFGDDVLGKVQNRKK